MAHAAFFGMWCLLLAAWAHGLPIETARGRSGAGQRISSNPPAATIVFESPASPHPHGRTLEDLEILVSSTAHSIHRQLQGNLLASGPAAMASLAAGTGPATDPEVARFQAYVGTLAPGVLATYFLLGVILIFTTCCCCFGLMKLRMGHSQEARIPH